MKVNRLENVFCNPPLPDGDYVLLSEARAKIDKLQFKIDMLMLEYCPDEMTREQLDKWGECQKSLDKHKGESDEERGK